MGGCSHLQGKHYLLMAIEQGHLPAMYWLGKHYRANEKNYECAFQYYVKGKNFTDVRLLDELVTMGNSENCLPGNKLNIILHIVILSKNREYINELLSNKNNVFFKWKLLDKLQDIGVELDDWVIEKKLSLETDRGIEIFKYRKARAQRHQLLET